MSYITDLFQEEGVLCILPSNSHYTLGEGTKRLLFIVPQLQFDVIHVTYFLLFIVVVLRNNIMMIMLTY